MIHRVLLVCYASLFAASTTRASSTSHEVTAVLDVVQTFFDTMESRDEEAARAILDPEGSFVSVRQQDGRQVVRRSSLSQYLDSLTDGEVTRLERMWEPQVLIRGPIAIVWTQYDFYRDGEFSHCGVDAFQLVKGERGWIINGGTYTVEPTGCAESPLGPPI